MHENERRVRLLNGGLNVNAPGLLLVNEDEIIKNAQEDDDVDIENTQQDDETKNTQEKTIPSSSTSRQNIIDLNDLPSDPYDRPPIASYNPNQINDIRRAYLTKGPFQPRGHKFPFKLINSKKRRFPVEWFDEFPWIEYSTKLDKAYCLSCYLFEEDVGNKGGGNQWSSEGFCRWGNKSGLKKHVGQFDSYHNKAVQKCENLLKQTRSIHEALNKQSKEEKTANYFLLLGKDVQQRANAKGILSYFKQLNFVFYMHLMEDVLSLTNTLSQHLQRKSQDLFEAAKLINGTKEALNALRRSGFDSMLERVTSFCGRNNIKMLDMAESYGNPRKRNNVTNRHHFEVEIFNTVLDMQLQEFENRFSEITTSLLENLSGLNPCDRFAKFNPSKIVAFSEMYPEDFSLQERGVLLGDLEIFYHTIKEDDRFSKLDGLCDLARLMVETGKDRSFPLVFRILKLALVLPVATPTVERCFSKLKLVKTDLRNRMSDDYLNNALVCAVEREVFNKVTNDDVMARFQALKTRRGQIY